MVLSLKGQKSIVNVDEGQLKLSSPIVWGKEIQGSSNEMFE